MCHKWFMTTAGVLSSVIIYEKRFQTTRQLYSNLVCFVLMLLQVVPSDVKRKHFRALRFYSTSFFVRGINNRKKNVRCKSRKSIENVQHVPIAQTALPLSGLFTQELLQLISLAIILNFLFYLRPTRSRAILVHENRFRSFCCSLFCKEKKKNRSSTSWPEKYSTKERNLDWQLFIHKRQNIFLSFLNAFDFKQKFNGEHTSKMVRMCFPLSQRICIIRLLFTANVITWM